MIARAARNAGILTVGVVTKPFSFEGNRRMRMAEAGIEALREAADTVIVIPNQNLFRIADAKTTFSDAFMTADRVLFAGVGCITDLIVKEGLINLDFADVKSVMRGMGRAMMGTGEAEGQNRAMRAAEAAIANPLLDDISVHGARGVLISISGGSDMTLFEVDEAASRIRDEVQDEADIVVGAIFDRNLDGRFRVSVVATGWKAAGGLRASGGGVCPHPNPLPVWTGRGDVPRAGAWFYGLLGACLGERLPRSRDRHRAFGNGFSFRFACLLPEMVAPHDDGARRLPLQAGALLQRRGLPAFPLPACGERVRVRALGMRRERLGSNTSDHAAFRQRRSRALRMGVYYLSFALLGPQCGIQDFTRQKELPCFVGTDICDIHAKDASICVTTRVCYAPHQVSQIFISIDVERFVHMRSGVKPLPIVMRYDRRR